LKKKILYDSGAIEEKVVGGSVTSKVVKLRCCPEASSDFWEMFVACGMY
jgi:hypothetical protein